MIYGQAVVVPRGQEDGEGGGKEGESQASGGLICLGVRYFLLSLCLQLLCQAIVDPRGQEDGGGGGKKGEPQAYGGLIYLGLRSFHCRFAFSCCIKWLSTREARRIEKEEPEKERPRRPQA